MGEIKDEEGEREKDILWEGSDQRQGMAKFHKLVGGGGNPKHGRPWR